MHAAELIRRTFTRRTGLVTLVAVTAAGGGLFAFLRLYCGAIGVDFDLLTQDPAYLGHQPFYTGTLSNLGQAGWGAAIGLSLFTWIAFRRGTAEQRELSSAFRYFTLLSALLAADDLVQIHEWVAPHHLGIKQIYVYVLYLAVAVVFVVRYRAVLLERAPLPFAMAICGLAGSVVTDVYGMKFGEVPLVIEDGLKFVGIVNWAAWAGVVLWGELAAVRATAATAASVTANARAGSPDQVNPAPRAARAQ